MRPMFLPHVGEYLTGSHIQTLYRYVNVWIPAKDTGIDLLVSGAKNTKAESLQVKFSKDFLVAHMQKEAPEFQLKLQACGWWTVNREKLRDSPASYWVFVLQGFANRSVDYIVIPRQQLMTRLQAIHGNAKSVWQVYLWITKSKRCWEVRGLTKEEKLRITKDKFHEKRRDFTKFLNKWDRIEQLNKES